MNHKKRGLGKGLAALLENDIENVPAQDQKGIAVALIDANPYQPRKVFDEASLMALAKSIQQHGVIQPVAVRKVGERYELIAGERRLRAAKLANLIDIPTVVPDVSDRDSATFALIENLQREDLNVIEKATSIKSLIDQFGLTHEQCADHLGQSRSSVSNLLRLLTLSAPVQTALQDKVVDMGHARALINLSAELQKDALDEIKRRNLTVRETEAWVKKLAEPRRERRSANRSQGAYQYLAKTLTTHLGANVAIVTNEQKGGKVYIDFDDADKLKNIISVMGIDWIEPN